jgi:hypothetical protein
MEKNVTTFVNKQRARFEFKIINTDDFIDNIEEIRLSLMNISPVS